MTEEKTDTGSLKGVLLLNYGGPRSEEEVYPFLEELFNDPFIFKYPSWVRKMLAKKIAKKRSPKLIAIYEEMGGYSPIWEETDKQASALGKLLGKEYRVFTSMRYFPGDLEKTAREIAGAGIGQLLIFPLYPQESDTTTSSSIDAARRALVAAGYIGAISEARGFCREDGFINAVFDLLEKKLAEIGERPRIIFSAHGLPVKLSLKDRYYEQIKETAIAISRKLSLPLTITHPRANEWQEGMLAFQSKVGPAKWLRPSLEEVIEEWSLGNCRSVVVVPISFVSEHSETLYELDIYYKKLAEEHGMTLHRVPTVQCHPLFINSLAAICQRLLNG
jgi:protoporphyrin/coproporphyrin ferrochelatase